jgi:hypothetical protein
MIARLGRVAVAAVAITSPALAQRSPTNVAGGTAAAVAAQRGELAVPESPAFALLGASPANVQRPATVREFAAALVTAADPGGRARRGFALEVAPVPVLGRPVSLAEYQRDAVRRMLYRLTLSAATVQGGDSADTDAALGVRIALLDGGDLMQNAAFSAALGAALAACRPAAPGESALACLRDSAAAVRKRFERWNPTQVVAAGAVGIRFVASRADSAAALGHSVWIQGAAGLGAHVHLLGALQYARAEDSAGARTEWRFGARALLGSAVANGFAEVNGIRASSADTAVKDGRVEWSAGIEMRVAHGLWVSAGFGTRYADARPPGRVVVLANVRWSLAGAPRLAP